MRLGSVSVLGVVYSVSIHAPRAGCDSTSSSTSLYLLGFQFTHPVRGATNVKNQVLYASGTFQFTHPVRGATASRQTARQATRFQFTHPVRGATFAFQEEVVYLPCFNSRTPCGVRLLLRPLRIFLSSFNSRTPCGVRLKWCRRLSAVCLFQFTHPVRGATHGNAELTQLCEVSIHAPRAGCDSNVTNCDKSRAQFQFTHPVRGATQRAWLSMGRLFQFQFTHPVRGATTHAVSLARCLRSFNSRTPCGVRR